MKELTCLNKVSRLKDDPSLTLPAFLNEVVRLIPTGWQYQENTSARIVFQGREFTAANFCESGCSQTAKLIVDGEQVGMVEVNCPKGSSSDNDEPTMKQQQILLDTLASEISTFIRFKQDDLNLQLTSNKLRVEQQLLEDKNTALREVLEQIENEKQHIIQQVQTNVDRVVGPILRSLANKVGPSEQRYLTLLSTSLEDVTSPFLANLENRSHMLSPREGEICNMIRNGMSSKEIALALDVSLHTVLKQRQRVRKKLGITNDQINLASYLRTI